MSEPKTRPTDADVGAHLDSLPDPRQRSEAQALARLMTRVSGEQPVLWGSNIVGFGSYLVDYGKGKAYDWPLTGFAARAKELTLYLMDGFAGHAEALAALGRHRIGKSCLYLRSLADVDLAVLERMLQDSLRTMRTRHAARGSAAPAATAGTPAARTVAGRKSAARKQAPSAGTPAPRKRAAKSKAAARSAGRR